MAVLLLVNSLSLQEHNSSYADIHIHICRRQQHMVSVVTVPGLWNSVSAIVFSEVNLGTVSRKPVTHTRARFLLQWIINCVADCGRHHRWCCNGWLQSRCKDFICRCLLCAAATQCSLALFPHPSGADCTFTWLIWICLTGGPGQKIKCWYCLHGVNHTIYILLKTRFCAGYECVQVQTKSIFKALQVLVSCFPSFC